MTTRINAPLVLVAAAFFAMAGYPAVAQDAENPGRTLPEVCTKDYDARMDDMSMGGMHPVDEPTSMHGSMDMTGMSEGQVAMMAGMADMDANMMKGMMADGVDKSFICGMIPHHQGAIDMARAELEHGSDPFARDLAQQIIDAQVREINMMLDWLAKQP
jgi:uncharacterized protein (DUF305 family)